ncbi:MAG TPA: transketolase C-terminal domain-containing protein [Clostridia bacterium]|nr:transketolase C-terminal domain-containing protein [Clostridia bacterium]
MNKIANKQVISNVLLDEAKKDRDIVVLCSDSRGSASLMEFVETHPHQFIEVGIAEQNLVSISAGLASCGKKAFAVSPACFLSTKGIEQAKVDVSYSDTNVKLIGISGGVSYGALGMTHHSTNDIAAMGSIPNMRVYLPSDRFQTESLIKALLKDDKPCYVRVGRNAVEDVYEEGNVPFKMDRASVLFEGEDITLISCGELVIEAKKAAIKLKELNINARVIDMYCVKPIDREIIIKAAKETGRIITIEEHTYLGGIGSIVSQITSSQFPTKVVSLALPDAPVITGTSREVFKYYGLDSDGIVKTVLGMIENV